MSGRPPPPLTRRPPIPPQTTPLSDTIESHVRQGRDSYNQPSIPKQPLDQRTAAKTSHQESIDPQKNYNQHFSQKHHLENLKAAYGLSGLLSSDKTDYEHLGFEVYYVEGKTKTRVIPPDPEKLKENPSQIIQLKDRLTSKAKNLKHSLDTKVDNAPLWIDHQIRTTEAKLHSLTAGLNRTLLEPPLLNDSFILDEHLLLPPVAHLFTPKTQMEPAPLTQQDSPHFEWVPKPIKTDRDPKRPQTPIPHIPVAPPLEDTRQPALPFQEPQQHQNVPPKQTTKEVRQETQTSYKYSQPQPLPRQQQERHDLTHTLTPAVIVQETQPEPETEFIHIQQGPIRIPPDQIKPSLRQQERHDLTHELTTIPAVFTQEIQTETEPEFIRIQQGIIRTPPAQSSAPAQQEHLHLPPKANSTESATIPSEERTLKVGRVEQAKSKNISVLAPDHRPAHIQLKKDYMIDQAYKVVTDPSVIHQKLEKELQKAKEQNEVPKLIAYQRRLSENPNLTARYLENKLPEAITDEDKGSLLVQGQDFEYKTLNGTGVAFSKVKKTRYKQKPSEDKHTVEQFTIRVGAEDITVDLTGVFDGHGGPEWSLYASENLTRFLKARLEQFNKKGLSETGIWNALKVALVDLDLAEPPDHIKALKKGSGTTANIVLRIQGDVWTANSGDSRAILIPPDGLAYQLSRDASPDDPEFKEGINNREGTALGGRVWMIGQNLGVARGLGDHGMGIIEGENVAQGVINARPKITRIPKSQLVKGAVLVQVSDGIMDVAFNKDVGQLVHDLRQQGKPPAAIAFEIAARAYVAGSRDDLTALVTPL